MPTHPTDPTPPARPTGPAAVPDPNRPGTFAVTSGGHELTLTADSPQAAEANYRRWAGVGPDAPVEVTRKDG